MKEFTTAPELQETKNALDHTCAPNWHTAAFGRDKYTPVVFICPVCSNTACRIDLTRRFVVETRDNKVTEIGATDADDVKVTEGGNRPGVWIPMVCGNDAQHRFTLAFDEGDYMKTLEMSAHLEDSTFEYLYPEAKEKWGSKI